MSKLFALWAEYKWVVLAVLFLIVAAVSWDISNKVAANEFNAERIRLLQQTIEVQKQNEQLERKITTAMFSALETARLEIQKSNKAAIDEVLKNPIYRTCTITDGVRNAYSNAIRSQSTLGKSANEVSAPKGTAVR